MRRDLGELPSLAVRSRARLARRGDGQRRLQVLSDCNQLRQPGIARVRAMPSPIKKPGDTDQVTNRLCWKRTRHTSRERQLRLGVNGRAGLCLSQPRSRGPRLGRERKPSPQAGTARCHRHCHGVHESEPTICQHKSPFAGVRLRAIVIVDPAMAVLRTCGGNIRLAARLRLR